MPAKLTPFSLTQSNESHPSDGKKQMQINRFHFALSRTNPAEKEAHLIALACSDRGTRPMDAASVKNSESNPDCRNLS